MEKYILFECGSECYIVHYKDDVLFAGYFAVVFLVVQVWKTLIWLPTFVRSQVFRG